MWSLSHHTVSLEDGELIISLKENQSDKEG